MLTCYNTALHILDFDSSRQLHLACIKTTSGGSVWDKASCSQRDEETKSQNVTSLKYKCPWPRLCLLAWRLSVTLGDFSLTFIYALWYSQWHLETNYEYLRVYFFNVLMELFSLSFNNTYFTDCGNNMEFYKESQSSIILFICFFFFVHSPCVNGIYTIIWIFTMIPEMLYPQRTINNLWMPHTVYISKLLLTIYFWNAL